MGQMKKKVHETVLPIAWASWDQLDIMHIQWTEVEMTDDFGPFKKGESINYLSFDMETATISEFSEEGEKLRNCNVKLTPVL